MRLSRRIAGGESGFSRAAAVVITIAEDFAGGVEHMQDRVERRAQAAGVAVDVELLAGLGLLAMALGLYLMIASPAQPMSAAISP